MTRMTTRVPMSRRSLVQRAAIAPVAIGGVAASLGSKADAALPAAQDGAKIVRMNTTVRVGTHPNPIWFIGTGSQWHSFPFIWLPLVFYNAQGQMEPWLAATVEAAPDATSYTFKLHENAVWTDGVPITSEDVKFSYELFVHPATEEIGSIGFTRLVGVTGVEAFVDGQSEEIAGIEIVDEKTVRFNLDSANSLFLYDSIAYILPKHILGDVPIPDLPSHPYVDNPDVTSGPFRLGNYVPQQVIELDAWTDYWGEKKPKIDRLVLVQVDGPAVMNSLEAGELDFGVYLGVGDLERLEETENVTPLPTLSAGFDTLYVNGRKEYLQDARIRQAFLHAIDRPTLNLLLFEGQAIEINSNIFGPDWAINPDLNTYPYDPDRARELLAEADWDSSRTLIYWTTEGSDPRAAFLQAQLQAVGVNVEIRTEAFAAVTDAYASNSFDLAARGGGLYALDPGFAATELTCGSNVAGWTGYCNPEIDELFVAGRASSDQAERQEIYWRIAEIDNNDLASVYLFRPPTIYAVSSRLQGLTPPISFRFANTSLLDWDVAE